MKEQEIIEKIKGILRRHNIADVSIDEKASSVYSALKQLGFVHRSWVGVDEESIKNWVAQEIPTILSETVYKGKRIKYDKILFLESKLSHCAERISKSDIIKIKERYEQR